MTLTPLSELKPGKAGVVKKIKGTGPFFTRLRSMGLKQDTSMQVVGRAPFGGALKVKIMGCDLALRKEQATQILLAV